MNVDEKMILPGFEHIVRFWSEQHHAYIAKIKPGEYYVTKNNEIITTVVGSCVSVCVRDKKLGIAGMNHFMLPIQTVSTKQPLASRLAAACYGNWAMEILINELIRYGAERSNLELKVFGGSNVLQRNLPIGEQNARYVLQYIKEEKLNLLGQDLGSNYPRKIVYYTETGIVHIKKLISVNEAKVVNEEQRYLQKINKQYQYTDIEIF